jgi:hypothetical protein
MIGESARGETMKKVFEFSIADGRPTGCPCYENYGGYCGHEKWLSAFDIVTDLPLCRNIIDSKCPAVLSTEPLIVSALDKLEKVIKLVNAPGICETETILAIRPQLVKLREEMEATGAGT